MKNLFYISCLTLLSAIMLVETVGMYITKSICSPCGSSSYEVEFVVANDDDSCDHHHTTTNHDACSEHNSCEDHHHEDETHEHNKELHYVNHAPSYFSLENPPSFEPQLLIALLPVIEFLCNTQEEEDKTYIEAGPPLPVQSEDYLAYICTFLI